MSDIKDVQEELINDSETDEDILDGLTHKDKTDDTVKHNTDAAMSEDEISLQPSDMSGLSVSSDSKDDEPIVVGVRCHKVIADDTDIHPPSSPFRKKTDNKGHYNYNDSTLLSPQSVRKKIKVTTVTPTEKNGYQLRSSASPLASSGKGTVL